MMNTEQSQLVALLCGASVFGRDIDSKILQASNEVSCRAMFELLQRCDTNRDGWARTYAESLLEMSTGDPSVLIGFDDGRWQGREDGEGSVQPSEDLPLSVDYFLKLEFSNEDAAYYQFTIFPSFDEPFIGCASRKREGKYQYLSVTLTSPDDLQVFIQNLRSNPHLEEVHHSNEGEFSAARSEAV